VAGVVQTHVGERHVADRQVKVPVGQARRGERLGADRGVRVQRPRDLRRRRVEFNPGQLHPLGRHAEEDPRATPGLEHSAAAEAEINDRLPDRGGHLRVGVVRVDRRAPRRVIPPLAGERAQLLAHPSPLSALLIEQLRHRPPARPGRQHELLLPVGGPALALEHAQQPQRLQVGLSPRALPARGQQADRRRRELRRRGRRRGYSSSRRRCRSRISSI
jgi:hypothetical protein